MGILLRKRSYFHEQDAEIVQGVTSICIWSNDHLTSIKTPFDPVQFWDEPIYTGLWAFFHQNSAFEQSNFLDWQKIRTRKLRVTD